MTPAATIATAMVDSARRVRRVAREDEGRGFPQPPHLSRWRWRETAADPRRAPTGGSGREIGEPAEPLQPQRRCVARVECQAAAVDEHDSHRRQGRQQQRDRGENPGGRGAWRTSRRQPPEWRTAAARVQRTAPAGWSRPTTWRSGSPSPVCVITNTSSRARRRKGSRKNIATRPANATATTGA